MNVKLYILLVLSSFTVFTSDGFAQVGGTDMWIETFKQWGLFTPHEDYCDSSTEVFITISGTASRGFCIEKNERAAAIWEEARDACASDKKRLPEIGEWKFACNNSTSLSNMTDDFEWASNTTIPMDAGGGSYQGLGIPMVGNGSCYDGVWGYTARTTPSAAQQSYSYRCVR